MKNILVPTDFSLCSTYAVELGLALAEAQNAQLHLFTCSDDPQQVGLQNIQSIDECAFTNNVKSLFDNWVKEAEVRGVTVKTFCTRGKLVESIQQYISENPIDLIVIGSHGESGNSNLFMGSNTQRVVRAIHIPVMIVKQRINEYAFKNIVYASDFKPEELEPFIKFLDFIKVFKPDVIHLLSINTAGWTKPPYSKMPNRMKAFQPLVKNSNCKIHLYPDISLEAGIRHFALAVDADLVVVSNHFRDPIHRMLHGSNVEGLVNHCELPLLTIDYPENNIIGL